VVREETQVLGKAGICRLHHHCLQKKTTERKAIQEEIQEERM
jgi:hypothetical protein